MNRRQPPTLRAVAWAVADALEVCAARLREGADPVSEIDAVLAVVFAGQRALTVAWLEGRR